MKRYSTAVWHGSGKEGNGTITSQSKAINNANYAWNTRFADAPGTNPEELLAAAHASCFTMKLSFLLSDKGFIPEEINTTSTITIEGSKITESQLVVNAKVPGINKELFTELSEKAKKECPVSNALSINITMEAKVEELAKV
jgi:osmotically inducible protein OsmC